MSASEKLKVQQDHWERHGDDVPKWFPQIVAVVEAAEAAIAANEQWATQGNIHRPVRDALAALNEALS